LLLDAGAEVDLGNRAGVTPLMKAAERDDPVMINLLLDRGAVATRSTVKGWNAATYAVNGSGQALGLLLAAGAPPDGPPGTTVTPLILAATMGKPDLVDQLLDAGAEIDLSGIRGVTPLMSAAYNGREETVLRLLQRGADPDMRDELGRSAADMAESQGHPDLANLIAAAAVADQPTSGLNSDALARRDS
jgi:ankyrin repeat protein